MSDLKPVAWNVSCELLGKISFCSLEAAEKCAAGRKSATITPLYAIPEGYVLVPVEKIKEAVIDGFMASGEGYNGEYCGRLDSEEQARDIANKWVEAKIKAAQEEG